MNTISKHSVASALQLAGKMPAKGASGNEPSSDSLKGAAKTGELHEKFTQFVGEAFYGQMLKSMRDTVGKPAYFYGGHAEKVFQGQLDQTMAEHLTKASASTFADPMFERQFPQFAEAKPARPEAMASRAADKPGAPKSVVEPEKPARLIPPKEAALDMPANIASRTTAQRPDTPDSPLTAPAVSAVPRRS